MKSTAQEAVRHADALYDAREQDENIRASLEVLRPFIAHDYDAAWRAARALFFLGQEATAQATARDHHARAAAMCARATRLCPARVEAHFWHGVNLALLAQLSNTFRALPLALRARRALLRAARIDPAYHAAGPLRVVARLEAKLPRWLGGGHARAHAHFEQALRLAPHNTVTRLYFAEMLFAAGDHAGAHDQLRRLLAAPPDPAWNFETTRDRRRARQMLASGKDKKPENAAE